MDHVDRILAQWATERPDLDVGPMGLFGRLKRLTDHLQAEIDAVYRKHGLSFAAFDVLATLRRSGPPYALSPTDLINWTMVTSGTMTNRIDRLQTQGLIERRPNPDDGRSTVVALTEAGFALIDMVINEHVANQHRLIAQLPEDLRAGFEDGLRSWLASFEAPDSSE